MTDRVWIEIPAIGTGASDDPVRSKYPIQGKAFLMHQQGKVYVTFGDEVAREEAATQADCRRLTPSEASALEGSLPFPLLSEIFSENYHYKNRRVGLGDIVAWITHRVGIAECNACQQRKRWLNRIVVWGWWRRS